MTAKNNNPTATPTAPKTGNASSGDSPLSQSAPVPPLNEKAATEKPATASAPTAAKSAETVAAPTAANPNPGATATAEKPAKTPKPRAARPATPKKPEPGSVSVMVEPPGGEETTLPRGELVFDPAYQMRAELYNEKTVEEYKELMMDGVKFPPLHVADTGVKKIVFGGFNRGEAYNRAKINDIPVKVWKMTEAEALYWALRQNATHGLNRTKADIRKALDTFFKNPEWVKKTCDEAEGKGGSHRAIAAVVGASNGKVWGWLNDNKKKLVGGVLRDKTAAELKAEEEKAAGKTGQAGAPAGQAGAPAAGAGTVDPGITSEALQREKAKTGALNVVLHDVAMTVAKAQRIVEGLLEREDVKALLAERAKANNLVVANAGEGGFDRATIPALTKLMVAVEEVQKALTEKAAKEAAEAKKKAEEEKAEAAKKKAEGAKAQANLSPEASFDPKPGDADYKEWAERNPDKAKANEEARAAATSAKK